MMRAIVTMSVTLGVALIGVAARPAAQTQNPTSARALYTLLTQGQQQGQQGQQAQQGQQGQQGQQAQGQQGRGRGPQGPPKNLQVLPKDWSGQQVVAFMQTVRTGLGVQCTFCHENDRSLDTKPEKATARKMIAMTMAINDQYLKDVGEPPAAGTQKVTCFTCHRGMQKPISAPPSGGGGF